MANKKRIYVGCSLTHASEDFKDGVEKLKDALRAEGYEILDFIGVTNGTAADVFNWDIGHCIKDCDAFVAICDHPSLGLGYELGEAVSLKKEILAIAHKDALVTRLILGAAEVLDNVRFERYDDLHKDVVPLVNGWLAAEHIGPAKAPTS